MHQVLFRNKEISEPLLHMLDEQPNFRVEVRYLSLSVLLNAQVETFLHDVEPVPGHGLLHHPVFTVFRVAPLQVIICDRVITTKQQNSKEDVDLRASDVVADAKFCHCILVGEAGHLVQ
jgi:hypothetical protein